MELILWDILKFSLIQSHVTFLNITDCYEFFNPVLPYHNGGILTFPLCRACVVCEQEKPILQRQYVCEHTDGECMLRVTWCTPEISKAVEKGYRIPKIHEVCHFP